MAAKPLRAEHTSDTRAALLEAGRALFAERGYADTATEEVVVRARVTRGALYHHFRNKEDLFRAVIEQVNQDLVDRLMGPGRKAGDVGGDLWEVMCEGYQAYLDACLDPGFQRIVLVDGPAVLGQHEWAEIAERHGLGITRAWLSEVMDRGLVDRLPLDALARLLGAIITEAGVFVAHADSARQARSDAGRVVDAVLQGLRTQPASGAGSRSTGSASGVKPRPTGVASGSRLRGRHPS